jgi:RNA polymerase sigma factor (sigma-70 family)
MSRAAVPSPETEPSPDPVFNQFYRDYWWRLLWFVRKIARADGLPESRLDAEGVVQDTLIAAFRTWTTIEHPERWIYTVAARKVRRHARREWLQDRELRLRLQAECSKGTDSDPAHTHAVVGSIVDRIMALPTNQRIATYLSTVEEWTGPEIATLLGIAPATAYVHVSRGIKAVQRREGVTELSGATPGGSYRVEYRISIPRLLAAVALGLLLIAAIAGLVWFVFIFVCGIPAVWVIGAIVAILIVAGMRRPFRRLRRAFWRRQRRRRWE